MRGYHRLSMGVHSLGAVKAPCDMCEWSGTVATDEHLPADEHVCINSVSVCTTQSAPSHFFRAQRRPVQS